MLPTELAFSVEAISPHPALREPAALPQSRSVKGAKDASCYIHQLPPCKSPCRRECGRFLVLMHFAWGFFLSAMFRPGAMLYLHTFSAYLVTRTHFSEGLEVSRHHPWLFRNALLAPIHSCGLTDHLLT